MLRRAPRKPQTPPETKDELKKFLYNIESEEQKRIEKNPSIWRIKPVDFITFCRDFIGEPLFEGDQERLAKDCFGESIGEEWPSYFSIILLLVGKGGGKGSISAKVLTWAAYLLRCMKDPRGYFKIGKTAPIHLLNVSYNSRQAKDVFFSGYLVPTVLNTKNPKTGKNWFEEQGVDIRKETGDIKGNVIHFERPDENGAGGITAESIASDKHSGEGYSPLVVFIDEFSAMKPDYKASALLDALESSATSRFSHNRTIIIASYKHGKSCKMSVLYKNAKAAKDPHTYCMRSSTWSFNRNKSKDDFKDLYETNPDKAMKFYECLDGGGVDESTFFKRKDKLDEVFENSGILNPFEQEVEVVSSNELRLLQFQSWFKPIPGVQYNVHIDLAKGTQADQTGLVMTHKSGFEVLDNETIQNYIDGTLERNPEFDIKMDMALQIRKDPSIGEIVFEDIRKFLYRLKNMGFKIHATFDGFNSIDMIQQLNQKGIPAEQLSVDRGKTAYETLQTVIYRSGFKGYYHPVLYRELEELEESEDGKKIDHPFQSVSRPQEDGRQEGSKDLSDACAGSIMRSVMAPPPSIPLRPTMSESVSRNHETKDDFDRFEQDLTGGHQVVKSNNQKSYMDRMVPFIK